MDNIALKHKGASQRGLQLAIQQFQNTYINKQQSQLEGY